MEVLVVVCAAVLLVSVLALTRIGSGQSEGGVGAVVFIVLLGALAGTVGVLSLQRGTKRSSTAAADRAERSDACTPSPATRHTRSVATRSARDEPAARHTGRGAAALGTGGYGDARVKGL